MNKAPLNTYTDLELALMVLLGYYGNGKARVIALGSRYSAVQSLVQKILDTGSIPAGTGSFSEEKLNAAIQKTFNDAISEMKKEIIENYGT